MKKLLLIAFILVIVSCNSKTELQKVVDCNTDVSIKNLETVKDMKSLFFAQIPKHWKTNLFYDSVQSSIYTADTTKQLTETTILDITFVSQQVEFDSIFKTNLLKKHLSNQLHSTKYSSTKVLNKNAVLDIANGKKGKFKYQVANLFIKVNSSNFMHIKTEIYGDSLVNKRLCEALNLIEKIKLE